MNASALPMGDGGEAPLPPILTLGDGRLRAKARAVEDFADPVFLAECRELQQVLQAFRRRHGFGRAIAAPQIALARRFIALNLGEGPLVIVNPVITWRDPDTFTLWDDCMSFPSLLVRVERAKSISLDFCDEYGVRRQWTKLEPATAELLQHEIDHLDGVLAVDRAIDGDSVIMRDDFEANRAHFEAMVDYTIQPTSD